MLRGVIRWLYFLIMSGSAISLPSEHIVGKTAVILKRHWLIGVILLTTVVVRLWGVGFGLPYAYHVDEPRYIYSAVGILQSGNLNPGWFQQPSLYTYLVTLVVALYFVWGWLTGTFHSRMELFQPPYHFDGYVPITAEFLLPRLLTVAIGVATVFLIYWIARRWMGEVGALASAAFLALSVFHSESSHYIATDVPVALFIIAALYFFYRITETGENRYYLLAGIMAGLAIGSKYSAYVLAVPAVAAHLVAWRRGKSRLFAPGIFLLGISTFLIFFLTTPYAVFDNPQFMTDLRYEWEHHKVLGQIGSEGNSGGWLLEQLLTRSDRWLTLLAVVGFGLALWRKNRPMLLVLTFTAVYFASMASNLVRFERFLVPMIPGMALAAGYTFSVLEQKLPANRQPLLLLFGVLLLVEPVWWVGSFDARLAQTDVRTTARTWIVDNIPADSKIAGELFSPNLDQEPYTTNRIDWLNQYDANWYRQEGYDYLIFAEARYGVLWRDPEAYGDLIAQYDSLWDNFELVAAFTGPYVGRPDHDIKIYKVTP
ncbi:MAG: glycosyltransferase family 39 protein [Candidatus Promineifilaceae bacterium]